MCASRSAPPSRLSHPEVVAACEPWALIDLDADRHPDWIERYQVEAYPTLILTDPKGNSVLEWVGYLSPTELQRRLELATARWPQLARWVQAGGVEATLRWAETANELEALEQSARLFRLVLRQGETDADRARAQLGWSWVQARQGNCEQAIRGYRRFTKMSVGDSRLERVEAAIDDCRNTRQRQERLRQR